MTETATIGREPPVPKEPIVHKPLTFGSLFSGIGGFDLGFERARLTCKWQVEIDDFCRKVLEKHWPKVPRHDDVKTFQPGPNFDRVDLICGGDPCQANSAAGRSTKESLGGEFLRVVDAFRPRAVVRENPSHIRADAPWPWWRFRAGLESIGYVCLPFRLRACCFGAEHRRERLFVLGFDANASRSGMAWWDGEAARDSQPRYDVPPLVHADNGDGLLLSTGLRSRNGVPDYVDRVRAIGNAVVPRVAEWIGKQLIRVL